MVDAHPARGHQTDVAVDAGARVPARVGLLRVVRPYGDDVARRAVAEPRRQLVRERAVAVRPLPQVMPVDPDFAVAIHPVELDEHEPARVPLGYGERLAVPAHAAGQRSAAGTRGIGIAELPLDAPVVRYIQAAPAGVVERRFLSAGDVTQMESPRAVERECRSLPLRRRCERGDEQREQGTTTEPLHGCTPNRYMVRERYSSAGRRIVDGNAGWLGESGKCCVSMAKPERWAYARPPFPRSVPSKKLPE